MRAIVFGGFLASLVVLPWCHADAQPARGRARIPPDRAQLDRRLREGLATVVQRNLGLNDDQMRQLSDVNQKHELRRRELNRRERDTRLAMRRELMGDSTPNEERIAQLLQESSRIQRERLDLIDSEQNDLARFLTPSQRAKYLGIQEQMRRRIEEMRERPPFVDSGMGRGAAGPGRGRGRRPPPPVP
jgi:Spy/CpxP family protein refolding chaperone